MSKSLPCPNCEGLVRIDHDDGQGYEEDVEHTQVCGHCEYEFAYTTAITFTHYAYHKNKEDHDMVETSIPGFFTCATCEYHERRPLADE